MNSRTIRTAYRDPFSPYFLLAILFLPSLAAAVVNVRMQTDLGAIDIELFDTVAPQTVANFMNYVNDGDYEGTFFHRSDPGFVVQGGGFIANTPVGSILTDGASLIPVDPPVMNEFNLSNVRGTIAMAKVGDDPDSATSQWFFNLADNSANLDNQNGGFTVFAQVLNQGMAVVDSIAALQRCIVVAPFPQLCGSFPDVPFTGSDSDNFTNNGLINISYIGSDSEGDGAIDSLEDAAPNNGDGNNDTVLDSTQQYVASFPDESGGYSIIEASPLTPMQSLNVLGITYARANPDASGLTTDRDFTNGYFSFDVLNVVPGDNVVTLTLPAGTSPDQFFNFGPTPGDTSPHWYEFSFDGTTGAEINANVIKLHFVDGQRGDSDLALDGTIKAAVGGAARITGDGDGIADDIEDGAPNNGDGNRDGIADSAQGNVTSLLDIRNSYVTVEADAVHVLRSLSFTDGNSFLGQADPQSSLNGLNFIYGFLSFEVANVAAGGNADIKIILPSGEKPVRFFKFGPTPANPVDHLYEFSFNGETGAEFRDNEVIMHFVDGKRGDSDLQANGVIVDPGTPAIKASNAGASSGGGGGCSLHSEQRHPGNAGDWLLLFALMMLLYLRNRKVRFY
jgi:cyclophilin family peptidyl-prolyl cis-trans isomerase